MAIQLTMSEHLTREELFRRYLFRELLPAEKDDFTSRLLADPALMDELRDYEYDLIDAHARGHLPPAEARKLDQYLAETGQQHRLAAAQALFARPKAKVIQFPWRATLALAAGLAIAAIGIQLRNNPTQSPAPSLARSSPRQEVLLTPATRDDQVQQVSARELSFQLAMDPPIEEGVYTAKIYNSKGAEILSHSAPVKTTDVQFELPLDASTLPPGPYQIKLYRGQDLINAYSFRR